MILDNNEVEYNKQLNHELELKRFVKQLEDLHILVLGQKVEIDYEQFVLN